VAFFEGKMYVNGRIDWTYLKVWIKFINKEPKSQTSSKDLRKSIPSYVFQTYIGDSIYMDSKKLWNHKLNIFHIHSTNSVEVSVFESKKWNIFM
jgi:hypothetical protein